MTLQRCFLQGFQLLAMVVLWLGFLIGSQAQAARLSDAASPYLLLHAQDAIDWQPWGTEALTQARRENKPIFLSIGYASCYWCHVLSRTTFKDEQVIATLNEHFVSVLVDREERPDLDNHFMEIMLAMAGRSGYPANFFLTPDLVPLFADGYLAPKPKYGNPGFIEVVQSLAKEWIGERDNILKNAETIRSQLSKHREAVPSGDASGKKDPRDNATRSWSAAFDKLYGGFGNEPKFLRPSVLSFLLHQGVRLRNEALLENVFKTLDQMASGGVRDQLGGAFHRYAVDRFWQVPHFEIMLNENALLARLYLEACQASGKAQYATVAREILDDLVNRFRLPGGSFAAALDAESGGTEGLFYTWTADEVRSVLGASASERFITAYVDQARGLVQGRSVLRVLRGPKARPEALKALLESRLQLLQARARRQPPRRDDMVLTSWNALAISAFAKAAQILDDSRYLQVALTAIQPLLAASSEKGRVVHSRLGTRASSVVFLDDYAFLVEALLDLYETDFQVSRLDDARRLMETLIGLFQAEPGAAFQFTPIDQASGLPVRTVLSEEGTLSGNAAALVAMHRLVLFGAEAAFEEQSLAIAQSLGRYLEQSAPSATGLLSAYEFRPDEAHEIVIVGNPDDEDTRRLLREVHKRLLHGTVLAVIAPNAPRENKVWPLLTSRPLLDNKATAYVCKQRLCDLPVNTPEEFSAQLDRLVSQMPSPRGTRSRG